VCSAKPLGAAALNGRLTKTAASWERVKFSEIKKMDDVELDED
jgi:hypothetical protein